MFIINHSIINIVVDGMKIQRSLHFKYHLIVKISIIVLIFKHISICNAKKTKKNICHVILMTYVYSVCCNETSAYPIVITI